MPGKTRIGSVYVISGAPCSGKTTVIQELERMGYRVVHEAARACIDRELQKGRAMDEIRGDALKLQQGILYQKLKNEANLSGKEPVFLDRGIPDSIAYYQLSGLNAEEALRHSRSLPYKKIFFFDMLDFCNDRVRNEDEKTAVILDHLISDTYKKLGYEIIRVPRLPVKDRTLFVLNHL